MDSSTEFTIHEWTSILQQLWALKLGSNSITIVMRSSTKSNLWLPSSACLIGRVQEW